MTLLLRLEAPMVSFGGVAVDADRPTDWFPSVSMITGLLANALGFEHRQTRDLQQLQSRVDLAAMCHRHPRVFVDYQTADLGQPSLLATEVGWTTNGAVEQRAGGPAKTGTHIRTRHFLADARVVVGVRLEDGEGPSETDVFEALRHPARPLFIGRKCCLPTSPIAWKQVAGGDVVSTLLEHRQGEQMLWVSGPVPAGWAEVERRVVRGRRDWANQIHVGERWWTLCRPEKEAA